MVPHDPYQSLLGVLLLLLSSSHYPLTLAQATTTAVASAAAATSLVDVNLGNARYKYVGCYNETTGFEEGGRVRALAGGNMFADDAMTVAKCLAFCGSAHYAGLEYQRECWCSPYLSSLSVQLDRENCNLECSGNASETCGGALKLTLYEYQDSSSPKKSMSARVRPLVSVGTSWAFIGVITLLGLLFR
ncbi:MAG: hypothetical protein M1813_004536 [Trichoglossum hirsutum]|nr:MAG: hypothetical protein M1813_004536 [Trichoglossum hirsutum]